MELTISDATDAAFVAAARNPDARWIFGHRFLYADNSPAPILWRARAVVIGLAALLVVTRLPRLDHPVFAHREFERASQDAFFVRVLGDDPRFDSNATAALLRELGAESIEEVGP
jgi:hypothetical protein